MSICFAPSLAPRSRNASHLRLRALSPRSSTQPLARPPARRNAQARPAVRMSGAPQPRDASDGDAVVDGPFRGHFGDWYLTQSDVAGVRAYRLSMALAAASAVCAAALSATAGRAAPPGAYDACLAAGSLSLGYALHTIHIYLRPLHAALKACWSAGTLGALAIAAFMLSASATATTTAATAEAGAAQGTAGLAEALSSLSSVAVAVHDQPVLLLAVGWTFVALTGVFIKEAFCFQRAEALALAALTPLLVGGRFLGVVSGAVEQAGAVTFAALFAVFAVRKFSQSATADLGDKSVFDHLERGGSL